MTEQFLTHWTFAGYFNCSFAEGYKVVHLNWCDGKILSIFDCFGNKYSIKRADFKLISVEARGTAMRHFIEDGYLVVDYYNGTRIICPWDIINLKFNKKLILLPADFKFQVVLPV